MRKSQHITNCVCMFWIWEAFYEGEGSQGVCDSISFLIAKADLGAQGLGVQQSVLATTEVQRSQAAWVPTGGLLL